jgi:predicted kinase
MEKQPLLLIVSGLPFTGQHAIASSYALAYKARHISHEILAKPDIMKIYRFEDTEETYRAMLERSREALLAGQDVTLDSTFHTEALRAPFRQLASETGVRLVWVVTKMCEQSVRNLIAQPFPSKEDGFELHEKMRALQEPLPDPHLVVRLDLIDRSSLVRDVREYITGARKYAQMLYEEILIAEGVLPPRSSKPS